MTTDEKLNLLLEKVSDMDKRFDKLENIVLDTRLHIENVTDKGIQTLAEGHEIFVGKYSKVEEISAKEYAYQVKVNYLIEDVEKLKKEIQELKTRIA